MVTSIAVAIVVLAFLIVFHELGHFLVAKRVGIGVLKFSIGFGPRLIGVRVGETEYVISAIPLGGFVKMVGEDPEESVSEFDRGRSFSHKSLWQRTAVVAAGPLANLLFALVAFAGVYWTYGARELNDFPVVGGLTADMPAAASGLDVGDRIVAVDGNRIGDWNELVDAIRDSDGTSMHFQVERGERMLAFDITPEPKPRHNEFGEVVETAYLIGIERGYDIRPVGPVEALQLGASQTLWWMRTLVLSIGKMITGSIPADQIGGPILIVQAAGQQAERGFEDLLFFMAIISVNLGILNLLPIPILDGGHLFFFAIEGVLRRPLSLRHREIAQQVGLALIIALMTFAFYNDIMRNIDGWWG